MRSSRTIEHGFESPIETAGDGIELGLVEADGVPAAVRRTEPKPGEPRGAKGGRFKRLWALNGQICKVSTRLHQQIARRCAAVPALFAGRPEVW